MPSEHKNVSPPGQKWCPACESHKGLQEFPRNRASRDGLATYCKPCHTRIMRANRAKHHGSPRNYWLKRRYGIDQVTASWLVLQQNNLCAMCAGGEPRHVDHNHTTGTVRGILCFNCNRGIAKFDEDPVIMRRAIDYLSSVGPR